MRSLRLMVVMLCLQIFASPTVFAGDFGWIEGLSIDAHANPDGFRATLATRFNLDGVRVNAVISNVGSEADAYVVLRMAEMSHRPVEYVEERYHRHHKKGWGAVAKDLGIKPGSRDFHALKAGHDLREYHHHHRDRDNDHDRDRDYDRDDGPGRGHGKGHGKGHGRGHDRDD